MILPYEFSGSFNGIYYIEKFGFASYSTYQLLSYVQFRAKKKIILNKNTKYIYIYILNAIASESVSAASAAVWNSFDWFLSHAQQY